MRFAVRMVGDGLKKGAMIAGFKGKKTVFGSSSPGGGAGGAEVGKGKKRGRGEDVEGAAERKRRKVEKAIERRARKKEARVAKRQSKGEAAMGGAGGPPPPPQSAGMAPRGAVQRAGPAPARAPAPSSAPESGAGGAGKKGKMAGPSHDEAVEWKRFLAVRGAYDKRRHAALLKAGQGALSDAEWAGKPAPAAVVAAGVMGKSKHAGQASRDDFEIVDGGSTDEEGERGGENVPWRQQ